jgi:hypothetical protein
MAKASGQISRRAVRRAKTLQEETVLIEASVLIRDKQGHKKLRVTFYGAEYQHYEAVGYWPNGRINDVEHGKTDDLIQFLREDLKVRTIAPQDVPET